MLCMNEGVRAGRQNGRRRDVARIQDGERGSICDLIGRAFEISSSHRLLS